MLNRFTRSGEVSQSTLRIGYPCRSRFETMGLTFWHGPHQVAVKSSTTPSRFPPHPTRETTSSLSGTMQASMPDFVSFEPDGLKNLQSGSRKCISRTPLPRLGGCVHFVCRELPLHVLLSLASPIMMCWPQRETGLQ